MTSVSRTSKDQDKLRKEIETQVREYLASGGVITHIPSGVTGRKNLLNDLKNEIPDRLYNPAGYTDGTIFG